MSVSDAKRLKELETENGRLKKLLAESQLEIERLPPASGGRSAVWAGEGYFWLS